MPARPASRGICKPPTWRCIDCAPGRIASAGTALIPPPACNVTGCNAEIDDASTDARVALPVETDGDPVRQDESQEIPGRCARNLEFETKLRAAPESRSRFYRREFTSAPFKREEGWAALWQASTMTRGVKGPPQTHRVCPFGSTDSMGALKLMFLSAHLELFRADRRCASGRDPKGTTRGRRLALSNANDTVVSSTAGYRQRQSSKAGAVLRVQYAYRCVLVRTKCRKLSSRITVLI